MEHSKRKELRRRVGQHDDSRMLLDSSETGKAATLYRRRVFCYKRSIICVYSLQIEKPPQRIRLREVYLGESYIHEHYHRNDDSLWDPNDDQDIQYSKAPAKGKRYCFAAAIQGPDPRVVQHDGGLAKERKAGLVPNTLWAYCPQSRGANTGDYHKFFDGENFVNWWKTRSFQTCTNHL
ncbi:hypothetical protein IV203_020721 [Nitzschia inconspicua]|uniref:Uncharacterized protein n=1 Tax=Nitzschia inconspicua TaxID=303405 RepID=A0A9K3PCL6_9STRA|nr:hypothetical protein IV203_021589 [Nitzschia inconspicua]KAG7342777.1 hypothetical protein IV203_020721 [Nitzschia inconspicua]